MLNKRMIVLGVMASTLLITGGCSKDPSTQQTKSYANDGYLGMTNVNPSLPINPTYHSYAADTEMMKSALSQVTGISNSRISLNGSHATVKLFVPKETSDADMTRIQQEAEVQLTKAAPRYEYYVKIARS